MKRITFGLLAAGLVCLAGCLQAENPSERIEEPTRLEDVVVADPGFTFATTETVRVEFAGDEEAGHRAIELFDADGRRLMDGAFKPGVAVDVRLPVGRADALKLRVGKGADAVERDLAVDPNKRAIADL